MKKSKKEKHFIHKPIYEGGLKAIRTLIAQNKKHPEEALKAKVEGTVVLKYSVSYKGNVTDVKVISGLSYGCDEEAIRLVKLLKFHVPKNRGKRVKFHKRIQIHFRLPKTQPAPEEPVSTKITYTVTSSKKQEEKLKDTNRGGGYTISF